MLQGDWYYAPPNLEFGIFWDFAFQWLYCLNGLVGPVYKQKEESSKLHYKNLLLMSSQTALPTHRGGPSGPLEGQRVLRGDDLLYLWSSPPGQGSTAYICRGAASPDQRRVSVSCVGKTCSTYGPHHQVRVLQLTFVEELLAQTSGGSTCPAWGWTALLVVLTTR